MEIFLGILSGDYLYRQLIESAKGRQFTYNNVILLKGFCPVNTEIARFPFGFQLDILQFDKLCKLVKDVRNIYI